MDISSTSSFSESEFCAKYDLNEWRRDLYNVSLESTFEVAERFLKYPVDFQYLKDDDLTQLFFSQKKIVQIADKHGLLSSFLAKRMDAVSPMEFALDFQHITTYIQTAGMSLGERRGELLLRPLMGFAKYFSWPDARRALREIFQRIGAALEGQTEPLLSWPTEHIESYFAFMNAWENASSSMSRYLHKIARQALGEKYQSFYERLERDRLELLIEDFLESGSTPEVSIDKLAEIVKFKGLDEAKLAFYRGAIDRDGGAFYSYYEQACKRAGSALSLDDKKRFGDMGWVQKFNTKDPRCTIAHLNALTRDSFLGEFVLRLLPSIIPNLMEST